MKCVSIVSCGGSEYNYLTTEALHTAVITMILFPFPAHWAWNSNGWLLTRGYIDYGGVGPIYLIATSSGAVLNVLSRKRLRYDHNPINPRYLDVNGETSSNDMISLARQLRSGGNVALAVAGAILNIFGSISVQIAMIFFHEGHIEVTKSSFDIIKSCIISMACGGITSIALSRIVTGQWSNYRLYRGMVSAIVICSGGGYLLKAWQCALLGLFSGITYILFRNMILYLGLVDTIDIMSTYGASGFMSIIITPVITMHNGFSEEWPIRLGWNAVGAASMISWSVIITFLVFYLLHYFDLLGQTSLFLNGIDKHQMREQHLSGLENIESKLCKCNVTNHSLVWGQTTSVVHGGDSKFLTSKVNKEIHERFNNKDKRVLSGGQNFAENAQLNASFENSKAHLQVSPNRHQCISPPRLMSTTSNIPLIANLPITESFEPLQNPNSTLPPRMNSTAAIPMNSTMLLKDGTLSERYNFPTPPPLPLAENNGLKQASGVNVNEFEEDSNISNNNRIKLKKKISRPQIKLVTGDESDASSWPRSPFEIESPRPDHKSKANSKLDNPSVANKSNTDLSEVKQMKMPETKGDISLSHAAVQNQLKMLKPLPDAERRASLAIRRDATPIAK